MKKSNQICRNPYCGNVVKATRSDCKFCSNACRHGLHNDDRVIGGIVRQLAESKGVKFVKSFLGTRVADLLEGREAGKSPRWE